MKMTHIAILLTVGLAVLAVVGDYFLKLASDHATPFRTRSFGVGLGFYAASAFGAVFVFRHVKLAAVGGIYCVTMAVLLTLTGMLFFNESLSRGEAMGLCFAVLSVALLGRSFVS